MLVLGIDPGTATTGYGLVSGDEARDPVAPGSMRLVECGVIRTRPGDPLSHRLREIYTAVREIIARHQPAAVAVEDVFFARNVRTTLTLGHARGVVLLAGAEAGLPIHEYPPAEIKKTVVGAGGATKEQVQYMLMRLLRLRAAPQPDDASDGIAAAVTCLLQAAARGLPNGAAPHEQAGPARTPGGAQRSTRGGRYR